MADVVGYDETPEGGIQAIPGKLYYRGYDVEDLVKVKGTVILVMRKSASFFSLDICQRKRNWSISEIS